MYARRLIGNERVEPSFELATPAGARAKFILTAETTTMDERRLLERITINPEIFGGKPIIRGHRLAVEHVLGMLAAGDNIETILEGYAWLEREDVLACLLYARRIVANERIELLPVQPVA